MRKISLLLLFFILTGCSSKVVIPDLRGNTEEVAINILSEKELTPQVEYFYSDTDPKDKVVAIIPNSGEKVEKGSNIKIRISKGPESITSSESVISWYNVTDQEDEWSFFAPVTNNLEKELQIDVEPKFGFNGKLRNYGIAVINDVYSKKVPVKLIDTKKLSFQSGEIIKFTIVIPISELDQQVISNLNISLTADMEHDSSYKDVDIEFSMTWPK